MNAIEAVREYLGILRAQEDDGQALAARMRAARVEDLEALVLESRDSKVAYDACVLIVEQYGDKRALPAPLAGFVRDVLRGQHRRLWKPGQSLFKNLVRDANICAAIEYAVQLGFKATRNDVSSPDSACDLVAKCFELQYEAVRKVWDNRES